jgi:hypothetical protein
MGGTGVGRRVLGERGLGSNGWAHREAFPALTTVMWRAILESADSL